jgi:succinate dehydrogenase hydrophobic anchor subunit
MSDTRADRLADAIADGECVDWQAAEAVASTPSEQALFRRLKAIAEITAANRPATKADRVTFASWAGPARLVIAAIAALKIALALAGAIDAQARATASVPWPFIVNLVAFGGAGLALMAGARRDQRTHRLGLFFTLIAAAYSDRSLLLLAGVEALRLPVLILSRVTIDAFLPFAMWSFVWSFPEPPLHVRDRRITQSFLWISLGAALVLIGANLAQLAPVGAIASSLASIIVTFDRQAPEHSAYWLALFGVMFPALPHLVWKSRFEASEERRRASLFAMALVTGIAPMIVVVVLSPYIGFLQDPRYRGVVGLFVYAGVLSIVPMAAYAALVHHVLDLRLIITKTLQSSAVRYGIWIAGAVPLLLFAQQVYANRELSVIQIVAERRASVLVLLPLGGLLVLTFRERLFRTIDRWILGATPGYTDVVTRLEHGLREATGIRAMVAVITREVDRAIHPRSIAVLLLDETRRFLISLDGDVRALALESTLGTLLQLCREEIYAAIDASDTVRRLLPADDQQWLTDGRFEILVPLVGSTADLLGVIALGQKRSERPLGSDDRLLLATIATRTAMAIENRGLRDLAFHRHATPAPDAIRSVDWNAEPGALCPQCLIVSPALTTTCQCGARTTSAALPFVFRGKYRVERQIGSGGMGVVYLATDLTLDRKVAIKTLPRLSANRALRLQREARTMAAVQHPNLATIFSVETWRGTPTLVVEYLEGGTLAHRMSARRLTPEESIDFGIVMADVLDRVHASGVLHRDIKPTNIGFTREGAPKLLDFGVAQVLHTAAPFEPVGPGPPRWDALTLSDMAAAPVGLLTAVDGVVGTPLYLSPEAIAGAEADLHFDLWSLGVVLFEAIAGHNPFYADTVDEVLQKITTTSLPAIRLAGGAPSEPLDQFFARVLGRDPGVRPRSAAELRNWLRRLSSDMSYLNG